ncbi:MAG: C39 family peptidase [Candidatus Xenobia bacterium]
MHVAIKAPYFCQWDNQIAPGGSCNMTSLAMALAFYDKSAPGPYARIADNLLHECEVRGLDRHELAVIAQLAREHGLADDASYTDSLDQVKEHLATGNPVIVQGTFTASGHVVLVCGVDTEQGRWLVNDPAGHWPHYENPGWEPGEQVWYDSAWFDQHAAPDGHVWAHLLGKVA